MTTHDRDKAIALREEADKFATKELQCEGEYHPDFHTVSDERFYAIAFEDGHASREAEIAYLQSRIDELMLEYCPNEMTKEQLDNWAAHQRPVGESELPETIRARSTK